MDVDFDMSVKQQAGRFCVAAMLLVGLLFLPLRTVVPDTLINKPLKCVSLKQGQICTERVVIRWTARLNGNYCLFSNDSVQPLACWSQARHGEHRLIYKDNIDWVFTLRPQGEQIDLATSILTIAWVYDRRRQRSGWRRFWKLF